MEENEKFTLDFEETEMIADILEHILNNYIKITYIIKDKFLQAVSL
jgi:hypothetical protein